VFLSRPKLENQPGPRRQIVGATATDSTLFAVVGLSSFRALGGASSPSKHKHAGSIVADSIQLSDASASTELEKKCLAALFSYKAELRKQFPGLPANCANVLGDWTTQGVRKNGTGATWTWPQFEGCSSNEEFLLLGKQALASLAGKTDPTVCETGQNYGVSAFAFLCFTNASVFSWDIGQHDYVLPAAALLQKHFPGRYTVTIGDSTKTLPLAPAVLQGKTCDLSFVDGGHYPGVPEADIANFAHVTAPGGELTVDDCATTEACKVTASPPVTSCPA